MNKIKKQCVCWIIIHRQHNNSRCVCVFVRPTFFVVQLCALVVYQRDKTGATDLAGNAVRTEFAEAERRRYFAQQSDDVQVLDAASAATSSQSVSHRPTICSDIHLVSVSCLFVMLHVAEN